MKIINLLNKIANGEEVPQTVIYKGEKYHIDELEHFYVNDDRKALLEYIFDYFNDFDALMTEVEIIEEPRDIEVCGSWFTKTEYDELAKEDKKIEKINDILRVYDLIPPVDENMYKIWKQTIKNHNKINEIIDYLMENK